VSYLGFCPPGVILPYAGSTAPDGWLLCDGSDYDQTTYSALYNAISTTYNIQINPTTNTNWPAPSAGKFRVPDYRGSFLRGIGTASGGDTTTLGGWQTHKTAKNGLASSSSTTSVSGAKNQMDGGTSSTSVNHSHTIGGDGGHYHTFTYKGNSYAVSAGSFGALDNTNTTANTSSVGNHTHGGTGSSDPSHAHSWSFGGATFTASGTTPAQTLTGDNETRPVNKGVNYIIKI